MVIGAGVARALLPCAWMRHGPLARTMGADAGVAGKIAAVGAASGVGTGIAVGVAGKVASMGSAAVAALAVSSFPFPVPLSACVLLSCPTTVALSIFGVELNIFFAAFQKFDFLLGLET